MIQKAFMEHLLASHFLEKSCIIQAEEDVLEEPRYEPHHAEVRLNISAYVCAPVGCGAFPNPQSVGSVAREQRRG